MTSTETDGDDDHGDTRAELEDLTTAGDVDDQLSEARRSIDGTTVR